MKSRPHTTLFMLMSFDGKISVGSSDNLDFDKDLPGIRGVKEGLNQYYDLEQRTDFCSFNTGRVMAKVGWNEQKEKIDKIPVTFVIVDNKPHLTKLGVENLLERTEKLYVVTSNENHPASQVKDSMLELVIYKSQVDLKNLFEKLAEDGIERVTLQSGSTMNAQLLRDGLVDELSIVVAPLLVGGTDTPSLIGGRSILDESGLGNLVPLKLNDVKKLSDSYILVSYEVINE